MKALHSMNLFERRVMVLGHTGLVGSSLVGRLYGQGLQVLTGGRLRCDLRDHRDVERLFTEEWPHTVYLAAATVGGILANRDRPAEFGYDNLMIATNVIDAAWRHRVKKLVFLGSSCIYPKDSPNPIKEESLLSGPLEPTNRSYAVAKIAGIELCAAYRRQYGCDFISVMPPNIYGERDHFDDVNGSHVMAALIRRIVHAKLAGDTEITIWGTGEPRREFMHADDLADALVFLSKNYSDEMPINVGWGQDICISTLASLIAESVGWDGIIRTDPSKPDGTMQKLMDVSRMTALGWTPRINLADGIRRVAQSYERKAKYASRTGLRSEGQSSVSKSDSWQGYFPSGDAA